MHPLLQDVFTPRSGGAGEASRSQGGINAMHLGDAHMDTADFGDTAPGNLRVDYVLPSHGLSVFHSGVFWPAATHPLSRLTGDGSSIVSSDHRLVWIDARVGFEQFDFLGEVTFPTGYRFWNQEVGGLSGLDYIEQYGFFLAISDDRSQLGAARYHALNIDLSDGSLDQGDVQFLATIAIGAPNGQPYPVNTIDPGRYPGDRLGLRPHQLRGRHQPQHRSLRAGAPAARRLRGQLPHSGEVPHRHPGLWCAQQPGLREPGAVTGPDHALHRDRERPLPGWPGGFGRSGLALPHRALWLDAGHRRGQRVPVPHRAHRLPRRSRPASSRTNGLVELLALEGEGDPQDTTLLALERSFSVGMGNEVRLFAIDLLNADDVKADPALLGRTDTFNAVRKELIVDIRTLGIDPDNLEGMAVGRAFRMAVAA